MLLFVVTKKFKSPTEHKNVQDFPPSGRSGIVFASEYLLFSDCKRYNPMIMFVSSWPMERK